MLSRTRRTVPVVALVFILTVVAAWDVSPAENDLRGAWHPTTYHLKSGVEHPVDGLIFFSERDWLVLFFVTEKGTAKRGSGEGGTYALEGDELVFSHRYHLSAGEALPGLPESPLRMEIRNAAQSSEEPCRIELAGDRLTIYFGPSGNAMSFIRSSGF